eukprot:scaffold29510_cov96-Isochrysis_galbana.AAC.1
MNRPSVSPFCWPSRGVAASDLRVRAPHAHVVRQHRQRLDHLPHVPRDALHHCRTAPRACQPGSSPVVLRLDRARRPATQYGAWQPVQGRYCRRDFLRRGAARGAVRWAGACSVESSTQARVVVAAAAAVGIELLDHTEPAVQQRVHAG